MEDSVEILHIALKDLTDCEFKLSSGTKQNHQLRVLKIPLLLCIFQE